MPRESVTIFIDYENIRRGLWRHFQKRVPEDIAVSKLLEAVKQVSDEVGSLYEGHVFGDRTIRCEDAREIEKIPHFKEGAVATEQEIKQFCRERLADFKVPKQIVFMTSLPKTITGKIRKEVLRQMSMPDHAR